MGYPQAFLKRQKSKAFRENNTENNTENNARRTSQDNASNESTTTKKSFVTLVTIYWECHGQIETDIKKVWSYNCWEMRAVY